MALPDSWIKFLASFGYLGYSPWIPGTFGSLGGVLIYLVFVFLGIGLVFAGFLIALFCLGSIWIADKAEKIYSTKDSRKIVIDEVAGMLITLYGVPFDWRYWLIGFVLFRVLDVLKPFPAGRCEKIPGGMGVVLDDLVSGAYAWGGLWLIILLTRPSVIP